MLKLAARAFVANEHAPERIGEFVLDQGLMPYEATKRWSESVLKSGPPKPPLTNKERWLYSLIPAGAAAIYGGALAGIKGGVGRGLAGAGAAGGLALALARPLIGAASDSRHRDEIELRRELRARASVLMKSPAKARYEGERRSQDLRVDRVRAAMQEEIERLREEMADRLYD